MLRISGYWARLPPPQRWMIGMVLCAVGLASINPPFADVAPLHHVPTVTLALAGPWLLGRWPLSTRAVACLCAFLLLHTLGGRYTYTDVPYDDWAEALTGHTISGLFGWTRNHYDRLAHFVFGILMVPVFNEILQRCGGLRLRPALFLSVMLIVSTGAAYEIFEWLLTLAVAGPTADAYNGQQGDMWDAQKDMALGALGALLAVAVALAERGRAKG